MSTYRHQRDALARSELPIVSIGSRLQTIRANYWRSQRTAVPPCPRRTIAPAVGLDTVTTWLVRFRFESVTWTYTALTQQLGRTLVGEFYLDCAGEA